MSPSWRKRVIMAIESDRIAAVRVGRGWRSSVVDQCELSLSPTEDDNAVQATLQQLLSAPGWIDGQVDVVLAEHYVRHAIIPVDSKLNTQSERAAFAKIVLRQTYGDLVNDWMVTISPSSLAVPTIATGVPRVLLNSIRASCSKVRLRSIQPALMGIVNQVRRSIAKGRGRLVVAEARRITLANIDSGHWRSINSRTISTDDTAALQKLLMEDAQIYPPARDSVLWVCDLTGSQAPPSAGWNVMQLLPKPSTNIGTDVVGCLKWALA